MLSKTDTAWQRISIQTNNVLTTRSPSRTSFTGHPIATWQDLLQGKRSAEKQPPPPSSPSKLSPSPFPPPAATNARIFFFLSNLLGLKRAERLECTGLTSLSHLFVVLLQTILSASFDLKLYSKGILFNKLFCICILLLNIKNKLVSMKTWLKKAVDFFLSSLNDV